MPDAAALARFNDDQRLSQWLGEMYRSHVLGVGDRETTTRLARGVVEADQRLQDAAKRKLAELEPVCAIRDQKSAYVEHKQLELLKKLVNKEASNG